MGRFLDNNVHGNKERGKDQKAPAAGLHLFPAVSATKAISHEVNHVAHGSNDNLPNIFVRSSDRRRKHFVLALGVVGPRRRLFLEVMAFAHSRALKLPTNSTTVTFSTQVPWENPATPLRIVVPARGFTLDSLAA